MNCVKCKKELNPETTGCYPFWDGYICSKCYNEAAEEFCRGVDALPDAVIEPGEVDNIIGLLKEL
jgi:hypothetical protein